MGYITLSYTLEETSPVHIGLRSLKITPQSQILEGGGYNSYIIEVENHCGTHVDAPGHFLNKTKTISEYTADELVFHNPLILNCPKKQLESIEINDISNLNLEDRDCIIFCTGFGKYRKEDPNKYLTLNPGIGPDLVYWIRKNYPNIKCIGIDTISISSYKRKEEGKKAHLNAFIEDKELGEPLLLVEDMKLDHITDLIDQIILVPWQIRGIDSAPCTVLAKIKKR